VTASLRFTAWKRLWPSELLEFPHDVRGLALNLEEDKVGVVPVWRFQKIKKAIC
jgi:F0F1-type ATP synthase alpha subunit